MRTEDLLHKYFEGETTREEERELKRVFAQEQVPEELEVYRSFFAFFEEETKLHQTETTPQPAQPMRIAERTKGAPFRRSLLYTLSGIAAGFLIILSIAGVNKHLNRPQDYVIIDGKKYVDTQLAHQQAQAAFNEVSFNREDIFEALFND